MSGLESLISISNRASRTVLGIMSGTSVDGIDVAICSISGAGLPTAENHGALVTLRHLYTHPYDPKLRSAVIKIQELNVQAIAELHANLGEMYASAAIAACQSAGIKLTEIDLIGCHGQTVYHHSRTPGAQKVSLQLGCGDRIAERTGCAVFSDFRARDLAAGGEGAPLTPYADLVLYGAAKSSGRVVLNLGGIANITVLAGDPAKVVGFDTGPANAPIDRASRIAGAATHDIDGQMARRGKVDSVLVEALLREDNYLKIPPPKSTGFEMYGDEFIERVRARHSGGGDGLVATVTEFVARSIAVSLSEHLPPGFKLQELIIAGGGTRNPFLIERIAALVHPARVVHSDTLGVPSAAREAMAFALFANDALCGMATSLPSVTGASAPRILGKLSFGRA